MENILVPTDFSDFAGYALDAAVRLAQRLEAKLHVLHILDLPVGWEQMTAEQKAAQPVVLERIRQAEEQMVRMKAKIRDVAVETHYADGKLKEAIRDFVVRQGIDLIVIGSHGVSGKNEFFIGSNTQKVVRTVHCPVLIIKEPLRKLNFEQVVFASNFNENERKPFLAFKNFVKHFIPKIHLVYIDTSSMFDPPYIINKEAMEDFQVLCQPFTSEIHIFRDLTVDRGIRTIAENLDADLIGISNLHRHPVRRMLVGSNVEALINHATVPVLSIDYPVEED